MGRKRLKLEKIYEGHQFVVRFRHPLEKETWRWPLGSDPGVAEEILGKLNSIFLHPDRWRDPPATVGEAIRRRWLGEDRGVPWKDEDDAHLTSTEAEIRARTFQRLYEQETERANRAERIIRTIHKQKVRTGPAPLLGEAKTEWLAHYTGRDPDHTKNVTCELDRFVLHFGAGRDVDTFVGAELEIERYLTGLDVGPGRRNQIRGMVLRLLEDSGAMIDRKAVPAAKTRAVKAARGPIRWLERAQAEALAKKLPAYWSELFRVHVALGLRPDELPTLHRDNFSRGCRDLTLAAREHLTLKNGSRKVNVPEKVRKIILRRLKHAPIVFPQIVYQAGNAEGSGKFSAGRPRVEGVHLWQTTQWFDRSYLRQLRAAKAAVNADETLPAAAKIHIELDARVARRTCGSLLLRAKLSIEEVAAILGDDPRTIRNHYARLISSEVDPSAAAI